MMYDDLGDVGQQPSEEEYPQEMTATDPSYEQALSSNPDLTAPDTSYATSSASYPWEQQLDPIDAPYGPPSEIDAIAGFDSIGAASSYEGASTPSDANYTDEHGNAAHDPGPTVEQPAPGPDMSYAENFTDVHGNAIYSPPEGPAPPPKLTSDIGDPPLPPPWEQQNNQPTIGPYDPSTHGPSPAENYAKWSEGLDHLRGNFAESFTYWATGNSDLATAAGGIFDGAGDTAKGAAEAPHRAEQAGESVEGETNYHERGHK